MRYPLLLTGLLALGACDSDMLHQDRPGGSDYRGVPPSTGSSGSTYREPTYREPTYREDELTRREQMRRDDEASREREYCLRNPGACRR